MDTKKLHMIRIYFIFILLSCCFSAPSTSHAQLTNPEPIFEVLEDLKKTKIWQENSSPFPRIDYVFELNTRYKSLTAWTLPSLRTFIFLKEKSLTEQEFNQRFRQDQQFRSFLAQILAHELAIYFDNKQRVVLGRNGNLPWFLNRDAPVNMLILGLLDHPAIAYPLAAARAFQVEQRTLYQLAEKFPQKYKYDPNFYKGIQEVHQNPNACALFIINMLNSSYEDIQRLTGLGSRVPIFNIYRGHQVGITEKLADLVGKNGIVDQFRQIHVPLLSGGQINLCVERARYELGTSNTRGLSNGPRPFSTGGSGR